MLRENKDFCGQEITDKVPEFIKHIDDDANYYVGLFGEAVHMEKFDKEFYSYVKPKEGEQGISFIYNVHINDMPSEKMKTVVDEMKSMNIHYSLTEESISKIKNIINLISFYYPTFPQHQYNINNLRE